MRAVTPSSRALRVLGLLPLPLLAAYGLQLWLEPGGYAVADFFALWVYNGLIVASALLCLARAVLVREERWIWLLVGLGLAGWTVSEIHFHAMLADDEFTPFPTIGDAFFLAFYPAAYMAFVLLARVRVRNFTRSLWLDGLIAALGVGAVSTAVVVPYLSMEGYDVLGAAVNLAYALGDLVLLSLIVGVFALTGWRPGRPWALLGVGLVLVAIADIAFLVLSAYGSYDEGSLIDALWPAATLTIGFAAWQPIPPRSRVQLEGARLFVVPCLVATVALALLIYGYFEMVSPVALALATATLGVVIFRLALTLAENLRRLAASRSEALTDPLTKLGNRRRLMADLEEWVAIATEEQPGQVLLFDLDGFKGYNDTFGHPAGDALLDNLGCRLRSSTDGWGEAYRLGGDEFCVVVPPGAGAPHAERISREALSASGPGYDVSASAGVAAFPADAAAVMEVIALADERLYEDKLARRAALRPEAA